MQRFFSSYFRARFMTSLIVLRDYFLSHFHSTDPFSSLFHLNQLLLLFSRFILFSLTSTFVSAGQFDGRLARKTISNIKVNAVIVSLRRSIVQVSSPLLQLCISFSSNTRCFASETLTNLVAFFLHRQKFCVVSVKYF